MASPVTAGADSGSPILSRPRFAVVFNFVLFLPIGVFYLIWTWSSELGSFGGDNAIYLLTAEYFSSASPQFAERYANTSAYPPLFPLLLAIFGGASNLLVAHIITTVCLLVAVVAFYCWLVAIGFSRLQAYSLSVLFALLPGTYIHSLEILSENFYLALSLFSLWAAVKSEKSGDWRWLLACAGFVSAATLTRTAGLALLAAFILYLIVHRSAKSWLLTAIALLPGLIFQFIKRDGDSYILSLMKAYSVGSAPALWTQWEIHIRLLGYGWITSFAQYWSLPVVIAVCLFGVICLAGLFYRLRSGRLDALYGAFYLLLILLWPFPDEAPRFMLVLLPVLIGQAFWLLNRLPRLPARRKHAAAVLTIAVLAVIVLPQWISNLQRFMHPLPPDLAAFKRSSSWYHRDYAVALREIYYNMRLTQGLKGARDNVPEGECIYSIKPSTVAFFSRRHSVAPPGSASSPEEFHKTIEEGKCKYFFFLRGASPSFNTRFYPLERMGGKIKILEIFAIEELDQKPIIAILAKLKDS